MTTMEIEARKALLIREILADINSEDAIRKLQEFVHRLKEKQLIQCLLLY